MKRILIAISALLSQAGCDVQHPFSTGPESPVPQPPPFQMDGRTHQWNLMGVRGRAGLMLTRFDRPDSGPVVFILSCTDPGYGGLTLAMGEPGDGRLSLQAGQATFSVDAARTENQNRVGGTGYFPDRWLHTLGAADQVVVTNGQQRWTFPGPGRALAKRFDTFCQGRR